LLSEHENFIWFQIRNASTRYEPRPLIEDAAAEAHTSRENDDAASFYSLTAAGYSGKVCVEKLPDTPSGPSAPGVVREADRLVGNMRLLVESTGETVLEVVSFMVRAAPGDSAPEGSNIGQPSGQLIRIRIQRSTMHRWEDGGQQMTRTVCCMDIGAFLAIKSPARWYADICDLLERRSDCAVLHVNVQAQIQEIDD